MKTFKLKFERYIQEAVWVEVKADSLDAAIEQSHRIDPDELNWEHECFVDSERLYCITSANDEPLAQVDIEALLEIPTWVTADLRNCAPQ